MMGSLLAAISGLLSTLAGCEKPVHFPVAPLPDGLDGLVKAYDTDRDGKADFFLLLNDSGRVDRIAYDTNQDGAPDEVVPLDAVPLSQARHLVIILDGFAYDVVKAYYDEGRLRPFHPPSLVISPYPSMTDLSLQDLLGLMPARGFEAKYYNRQRNEMVGGAGAYLKGANATYDRVLDYRADVLWDSIGYLYPKQVFGKELNDLKRLFDRREQQETLAYVVSSAGVGTSYGAAGQREALQRVERLVHQVLQETHGTTKVTLLSDHGHSYTPSRRIPLEAYLQDRGWRLTDRLRGPRDVAYVRFGLVTFASFATNSAPQLAADLIAAEGVELASYVRGSDVVVLAPGGQQAVIRQRDGRYAYEPLAGDPLQLAPILTRLTPDADGYYDADALLAATAKHVYPAPLQRVWRAHLALVNHPPDVIISLGNAWYSGAKGFAGSLDSVASTHGSLNCINSTTFIMSTIAPLPPLLRSRDVPEAMGELFGRHWPLGE